MALAVLIFSEGFEFGVSENLDKAAALPALPLITPLIIHNKQCF